jgi:hypothetical protein
MIDNYGHCLLEMNDREDEDENEKFMQMDRRPFVSDLFDSTVVGKG